VTDPWAARRAADARAVLAHLRACPHAALTRYEIGRAVFGEPNTGTRTGKALQILHGAGLAVPVTRPASWAKGGTRTTWHAAPDTAGELN